ncbi:hypothetical protein DF281_00245 [Kurthia zopfii]|nr:hypothetical protein DF281_00245 [Kurthia zopfii]
MNAVVILVLAGNVFQKSPLSLIDTNAGKFQLVIANAEAHEPIDILPNRRKDTIKQYLQKYGDQVEIVVMDMNQSFKAAVKEALNRPVIIAVRFHH